MKTLIRFTLLVLTVFAFWSLNAHDSIPGPKQSNPIVLKNGSIHTVSNGILPNSDLLFENGKIIAIGSNLDLPPNTRVVDLQGKRVYPGLISSNSILGLVEISAVRATRDFAESGTVNPNAYSATAINPDSELIPVTRANGVLISHVLPQGGLISGSSAIISLEGWTIEEMALERQAGIHIRWPRSPSAPGFHPDSSSIYNATKAEEKYQENLRKLDTIIQDARSFQKAYENAGDSLDVNLRDESLLPLLKKEIPAYITVSKVREIRDAVNWAVSEDLNIVIIAGNDAWRAADILKQHDIS
ncbi:MAG: imidazolonepropionase-like amidohydrolase, partial [Candidatus Pelagisphaera sp.]